MTSFVDKCSMAAMHHIHGGHYDKYGKVTKEQIRRVLFISQNMRRIKSINRLEKLFYVMPARNVLAIWLQTFWKLNP